MKSLQIHIEYLLTQHDCVVVPGWGAFVVQHSEASFDNSLCITAPRRWLSFNALLAHNDGILAHSVMNAEQCSYEAAMAYIGEQVSQWHNIVRQGNTVELEYIGSFRSQEDGSLLFAESNNAVVNSVLAMLPQIDMPMISDILSVEEEDNNAATTEQEITITWHRRAIQAIASVAAIVIFMLFIATPVDNFQPVNDYAGLVSTEILTQQEVATNSDVSITQEEVVAAIESAAIEEETIVCDHTAETLNSANTADETPLQVNIDTNTPPRYILVIGSLPTQELAQKQIAEFAEKGVSEHINIYEHNGRHRLYIDGYDTLSQAQERLDEINAQANSVFAGIWICSTL